MAEHKIELPVITDALKTANFEALQTHIDKFAKYLELVDSFNANYLMNLTYHFNISLVRRLLTVTQMVESKDTPTIRKRCEDFLITYSPSSFQRNSIVKIEIPQEIINTIRT